MITRSPIIIYGSRLFLSFLPYNRTPGAHHSYFLTALDNRFCIKGYIDSLQSKPTIMDHMPVSLNPENPSTFRPPLPLKDAYLDDRAARFVTDIPNIRASLNFLCTRRQKHERNCHWRGITDSCKRRVSLHRLIHLPIFYQTMDN